MDARSLFGRALPEALKVSPEAFSCDAILTVEVTGEGGGTWTLNLRGERPTCDEGERDGAECRIQLSHTDLRQLLDKPEVSLLDLYYQNRMKVAGDLAKAAEIPRLLAMLAAPASGAMGLAQLFAPMSKEQFLSEHWPDRRHVSHGPPERLAPITSIPELSSIHALCEAWRGTVRVFPPASGDEYDSPQVPPAVAEKLFDKGFAMVFNAPENVIPALKPHLRKLQVDLGLPACTNVRCNVYASPKGAGASPHFDQNANFVIQLSGVKVWKMAVNRQVVHPTVRHVMGAEVNPALLVQATGEFPREMPVDAETIHLRAGSVLFVPNAWWHSTVAAEHAISLNFTFNQPSWAEVVRDAIYKRLIAEPEWRELAYGASTEVDPALREQATRRLSSLLQQLPDKVRHLNAAAVIRGISPRNGLDALDTLDLKRDWLSTLLPGQEK
jgi:50S ribosomal protein L16 3-hydroxylase